MDIELEYERMLKETEEKARNYEVVKELTFLLEQMAQRRALELLNSGPDSSSIYVWDSAMSLVERAIEFRGEHS